MKKRYFDPWLLIIYLFLVSMGVILVYSSTYTFSYNRTGDPYFLFKRHLAGIAIGLIVFLAAVFIPLEKVRKKLPFLVPATLFLLLFTFLPGLGKEVGGANRWINLVFFSFQPSEIAKLTVVFYLASILEKRREYLKDYFSGVLPTFLICIVIAGIILFQKDFSTTVFILMVSATLLYVAGSRFIDLFLSFLFTVPILLFFVLSSGYRLNRIRMLFDLNTNPSASYQLVQSLEAFRRGGVFGLGPGRGAKKIPHVFNDFIFSVSGEELGLIGALVILTLFLFLWGRGMLVARQYPKKSFESILAFGLTFILVAQALLNIMVNLAIIFPTGVTLPFISYGRTSFIVSSMALGFLLQLSRQNRSEDPPASSSRHSNLENLV